MKMIITILTMLALSGCSTGISKTGIATTATTAVAATAATVVAGPVVGLVVGAGVGAATDVVVNEDDITVDVLEALPEEERADALKAQFLWETVEKLGKWSIAGVLGFFLLPLLIGYLLPNRRQKKLERLAFDMPDVKHRDI